MSQGGDGGFAREPIDTHELLTWGWSISLASLEAWTRGQPATGENIFVCVGLGRQCGKQNAKHVSKYFVCVCVCVCLCVCVRVCLSVCCLPK